MSFLRLARQLCTVLTSRSQQSVKSPTTTMSTSTITKSQSLPTLNIVLRHCFHSMRSSPGINQLAPQACKSRSLLKAVTEKRLICRTGASLEYMHRTGKYKKERRKKNTPMEGKPQLKGVVLKTLIKKPKKPNSANRKCVKLRLSTGKEAIAYVPGEGHNLQEHNIVLVQGGKLQDTPGVKLVCIRGKFDLPLVKKKSEL